MYKYKTFLAIIPARGGSKGIPNKNIREINGVPLINYTIQAAKKSKYLDRVIVSTDDYEIANISQKYGAEVPFLRPEYLAGDTSKTIDSVVHAINELEEQGNSYDYVVLLQPTQPLRESWHIDQAIEKIANAGVEGLASVSEVADHPVLIRKVGEDGNLVNLLDIKSTIRRQDFPSYYKINGAVYINKISENFDENISLNDNKLPYIMDSKFDLDIDTPLDLKLFKFILDEENKSD